MDLSPTPEGNVLYLNLFAAGGALLETSPQGDASVAVVVHDDDAAVITNLLTSAEVSSALAQLFLAGCTAGERSVRRGALR